MADQPLKAGRGELRNWIAANVSYSRDECLLWPYGKTEHGYGTIIHEGHRTTAHRLMCVQAHGEPSDPDLEAAHSCGNRGCCNPGHLRWATPVENAADRLIHGTDKRGEKSGFAALTAADVLQIVELFDKLSISEIAAKFGASESAVTSIYYGCSWAWMTGRRPGAHHRLERAPRTKPHAKADLTSEQVKEIVLLFGGVSHPKIARRYGVSVSAIRHISTGRSWGWLTGRSPTVRAA